MNTSPHFASLAGSRAFVTGASRGIGRAIALELAQAGADLVLHAACSKNELDSVADEIGQLGRDSKTLLADFSGISDFSSLAQTAWNALGGLDVFVSNAGADNLTGEAAQLDFDSKLDRLWEIDVKGTIGLSRGLGSLFFQQKHGAIVTIGWDQAETGMEGESGELFSTAKNAIMGFSRSLAVSLAPHVRVNCIAPGWIKTAWGEQASTQWNDRVMRETPLKRWGTPEDIAKLCRFLVSSEAGYLTGQVINANGGAIR